MGSLDDLFSNRWDREQYKKSQADKLVAKIKRDNAKISAAQIQKQLGPGAPPVPQSDNLLEPANIAGPTPTDPGAITYASISNMYSQLINAYPTPYVSWGVDYANEAPAKPKPPKKLPEEVHIGVITGWRIWNVGFFEEQLKSVAQGTCWPYKEKMAATCLSMTCHGPTCSCGVYAYAKQKDANSELKQWDYREGAIYILGEVSLWGKVVECTNGYRAQYAYPKSFIDNHPIVKRLAELYGVPIFGPKAATKQKKLT